MQAANWDVEVLDPSAVAAFLSSRLSGEIGSVEAVGHGQWSRAFTCGDYVVRFSAHEEDFRKDQRVARYSSLALPVPRIVDVGYAFGGFYAISERATGTYLDDLDARGLAEALPSLMDALDAARAIDISDTGGYGIWRADGNALHATWKAALLDVAADRPDSRIHGWRPLLAGSPTGLAPFEQAYAALQTLVTLVPEERHLVHSDLLNFNVLIDGSRVSAVFDWGSSLYGDFVFDIAWFTFWQPWYPAWAGIDFRQAALRSYARSGLEVPRFAERMQCYETWIGLDNQAYSAFKGRWEQLEAVAQRTLASARS